MKPEQIWPAPTRSCWGSQMLSVMIPGGVFVLPVRSAGRVHLAKQPRALSSADLARQLLYSAGLEDIQAGQLTSLQGFTPQLPGAARPLGVMPACRSAGPHGVAQSSGKLMQKILTPSVCLKRHLASPLLWVVKPSPAWLCMLAGLVSPCYLLKYRTWPRAMAAAADGVMLVTGRRPGTAQGLEAAKEASDLGYSSRSSIALGDMMSNR